MVNSTHRLFVEGRLSSSGFKYSQIDESPAIMYLLDPELSILYCNKAWDRFALSNAGEKSVCASVLGNPVLNTVPEPLKSFYQLGYQDALRQGSPWEHDFECSSARMYRLFRMRALPLAGGFLLVENSLRVEFPHGNEREFASSMEMIYRNENGMIVMCAHCRRTKSAASPSRWHWVPAYVESQPDLVSHGLCDSCRSFFFPPSLRP